MKEEKPKIKKCFIVKASIGFDIQIDEEELPKAMEIWGTGKIGQFKQGFLRGDLIAGIIEDKKRRSEVIDRNFDIEKMNRLYEQTGDKLKPYEKLTSLKDIFADLKLLPGKQPKQLK